jgi:hypothetical protein
MDSGGRPQRLGNVNKTQQLESAKEIDIVERILSVVSCECKDNGRRKVRALVVSTLRQVHKKMVSGVGLLL